MNIQGNEDADKAAKSATTRDNINFKSVPFMDTKFYSKKYSYDNFKIIGALSQLNKIKTY